MNRRSSNPQTLAMVAMRTAMMGVMTLVVLVLTSLVRVPTPARGYIHLGDAGVFFAAFAFGPWVGAVAGGLGTALADILGGFPQWAIFSLLIHGLQGWVAGWIARRWASTGGLILASIVGGVIVVGGYLLAGIVLSGVGAALAEIPLNVLQVAVGAVVGLPLYLLVRQAYPPITRFNGRQ